MPVSLSWKGNIERTMLGLLFVVFSFLSIPMFVGLGIIKLFSLGFITLVGFVYLFGIQVSYNWIDIVLGAFIVGITCSSIKSINPSATFYPLASYSFLIFFYFFFGRIVLSSVSSDLFSKLVEFSLVVGVLNLLLILLFRTFDLELPSILLIGKNYAAAGTICLLPVSLYNKDRTQNFRFLIYNAVIIVFCVVNSIRGVFILSLFSFFIYFWHFKLYRKYLLFAFLTLLMFALVFGHKIRIILEFGKRFDFSRINNQYLSFEIFKDKIFFGCGLDNAQIAAYNYDLKNAGDFLYYNVLLPSINHNHYGKLLSEVGLVSVLYFLPFLFVVYRLFNNRNRESNYSALERGLMIVVPYSLFLNVLYQTSFNHANFFSNIQFISFASLSILSPKLMRRDITIRFSLFKLFLPIVIIGLSVFPLYNVNFKFANLYHEDNCSIDSLRCLEERAYNKNLYTIHSRVTSLSYEIAKCKFENGDLDEALLFSRNSQIEYPNLPVNLELQSIILLRLKSNIDLVRKNIESLLLIHEDYNEAWMLLAELSIHVRDYPTAKEAIQKVLDSEYPDTYMPYCLLYSKDIELATNCIGGIEKQKWKIFRAKYLIKLNDNVLKRKRDFRSMRELTWEYKKFIQEL